MSIKPMLATASKVVPTSADYIIEPKLDGWRAGYEDEKLWSRTSAQITQVPYLIEALAALDKLQPLILDGEIIALNVPFGEQFKATSSILKRKAAHVPGERVPALTYVLFDVLELEGNDLKLERLESRRQLLKLLGRLLPEDRVRVIAERPADDSAEDFYTQLIEQGYEGIVAKRLDSPYVPGARNGSWIKCKPEDEVDVEITGVYAPTPGSKYDGVAVGGVEFRLTHPDGKVYNGRCAGMDDDLREALRENPDDYVGRVAVVAYGAIEQDSGALRFPRLRRFRDEKDKAAAALGPVTGGAKGAMLSQLVEAQERADESAKEIERLQKKLALAEKINAAEAELAPTPQPARAKRAKPASGGRKSRNYNAMNNEKLAIALTELEQERGEGYEKALETERNGGWSVRRHQTEATKVAEGRGLR